MVRGAWYGEQPAGIPIAGVEGGPEQPKTPPVQAQEAETGWRWATVTALTPGIRIRLDGALDPLPMQPDMLIYDDLVVGDRVWIQLYGRRVIVHGKAYGTDHWGAGPRAVPVGGIVIWSAFIAGIPNGWLRCDGAAVSRTTYAALYAVIADIHGAGDGTTTFNLPDLMERVPIGWKSGGIGGNVAAKGGAATVTLTESQMPAHSHTQNVTAATGGGTGVRTDYDSDAQSNSYPQGINTGVAGGGASHNNMQPYITMHYIIKY